MTFERKNEFGTIKLNDAVFAQLVQTGIAKCGGRAFLASEKGKLLGGQGVKPGLNEISANVKLKEEKQHYSLELCIIMSFGASINETTREILDYIEYEMRGLLPDKDGRIVLRIVGIKSKKIAERNLTLVREYKVEAENEA